MAKVDITKRPRRALSAEERQELFKEFKLGIFALAALVVLVVTLCWDRDAKTGSKSGEEEDYTPALVKVVWNPSGRQGGISPERIQQPAPQAPREQLRRPAPEPVREEPQARPEPPVQEAPQTQPVPRHEAQPKYRNYVVKRNDTAWKLAEKFMGNGRHWTKIRDANPAVRNINKLRPGTVIRIPNSADDTTANVPSGSLAGGPSGEGSLLLSSPTQAP